MLEENILKTRIKYCRVCDPLKEDKIVVFQSKKIRRIWHEDEWYFSVVDIIGALTESPNPRRYWSGLKTNLEDEGFELYGITVHLKLQAPDGKMRQTDCANTKSIFRIIQSIPSKKAEPFKRWLASVGYQREYSILTLPGEGSTKGLMQTRDSREFPCYKKRCKGLLTI